LSDRGFYDLGPDVGPPEPRCVRLEITVGPKAAAPRALAGAGPPGDLMAP